MANIRVPPNVGAITLVTSGALTPVNNIIACTAAEATDLSSPYSNGPGSTNEAYTRADGTVDLIMPKSITSITINGTAYTPAADAAAGSFNTAESVPAADASVFTAGARQRRTPFELING